jgi:BMFP domain-containing protein YqiC
MGSTFEAAFSDRVQETKVIEPEIPEVEETQPPEPETPVEPAKEEPVAPAKEPETPLPVKTVPHEALHAERKRREALEARLAELEKRPKTSVLEDEDKAFNERLSEATTPLRQQLFKLSVNYAKRVPGREDYDEVYDFMNAEVQAHPELFQQIDQDDPGESIYKLGKIRKELSEVGGDLTKYREHITAKTATELNEAKARIKALEAELAAGKASQEKKAAIPQSLNAEASGAPKDDTFAGPRPLKSVFSN